MFRFFLTSCHLLKNNFFPNFVLYLFIKLMIKSLHLQLCFGTIMVIISILHLQLVTLPNEPTIRISFKTSLWTVFYEISFFKFKCLWDNSVYLVADPCSTSFTNFHVIFQIIWVWLWKQPWMLLINYSLMRGWHFLPWLSKMSSITLKLSVWPLY